MTLLTLGIRERKNLKKMTNQKINPCVCGGINYGIARFDYVEFTHYQVLCMDCMQHGCFKNTEQEAIEDWNKYYA